MAHEALGDKARGQQAPTSMPEGRFAQRVEGGFTGVVLRLRHGRDGINCSTQLQGLALVIGQCDINRSPGAVGRRRQWIVTRGSPETPYEGAYVLPYLRLVNTKGIETSLGAFLGNGVLNHEGLDRDRPPGIKDSQT